MNVRIVGKKKNYGRVEVNYQGTWIPVCDDTWDLADATVVCRQLGFTSALQALGGAHFGPGSGEILLDDVECTGFEDRLADCAQGSIAKGNCWHSEDAGVVCNVVDGEFVQTSCYELQLAPSLHRYQHDSAVKEIVL